MRLRTFTAPDMPTAMKMVRDAMGDDAIILSSEPLKGKKGVTVTAAHDGQEEPIFPVHTAPPTISSASAESIRSELQQVLRFHNVPDMLAAKIFNKADPRELASIEALHHLGSKRSPESFIRLALEKTIAQYFTFQPLDFSHGPKAHMLVGPPGIGKTLTIAKIAAHIGMANKPISVFTCDTKRAGGIEQLQSFTNILNIELQVASTPQELSRKLKHIPASHNLLIDTAGANPYDREEMKETAQFANAAG
ncbi:MAG: hypothetical protein K2Q01_06350, partial [Rickettsiales bacterium]|nr:hypothetical protein [Rickettsiales bacterium]